MIETFVLTPQKVVLDFEMLLLYHLRTSPK